MAIFKCKMCGGNSNATNETKIVECEFCNVDRSELLKPLKSRNKNFHHR